MISTLRRLQINDLEFAITLPSKSEISVVNGGLEIIDERRQELEDRINERLSLLQDRINLKLESLDSRACAACDRCKERGGSPCIVCNDCIEITS